MEPAEKSQTSVLRQRRRFWGRFNPIAGLTPEKLGKHLTAFRAGYFSEAAQLFDIIEKRDDTLACVVPKRKKAVARRDWEVLTVDDSPEAARHKQALEYFYENLTVENAIDAHESGGWSLLLRQMMDAVGKKYAVHEILWQSSPAGMTAIFRFVPLWYFVAPEGALEFTPLIGQAAGAPLLPNEWLVTTGDGLMESSAVAYMYKRLPLRDWLVYCERNGMPGVKAVTNAAPDSPEWKKTEDAVRSFAAEWAAVFSAGTEMDAVDLTAKGELPYPGLVDRMDRKLAAIWRGGDLSSTSATQGQGQGASVQDQESQLLEEDDAAQLTGALNTQIDPYVLKKTVGADRPLAYVKIVVPQRQNVTQDLAIDSFLRDSGAPLSQQATAERYGRPLAEANEEILQPPAGPAPAFGHPLVPAANAAPAADRAALAAGLRADFAALADEIGAFAESGAPVTVDAMAELLKKFPALAAEVLANEAAAREFQKTFTAAAAAGAVARLAQLTAAQN